ncbi:Protein Y53G8AR.7 a [Aphelenchoides avenae]|nr:Protein Y53G8AR.7 a [Aphelenchus avenae]
MIPLKSSKIEEAQANGLAAAKPEELKTHWRSIYVTTALGFIGAIQFSLYFSSQWPYLHSIDKSATETFFAYIVAAYSLGQAASSPVFGRISNWLQETRRVMFFGFLLMLVGNICYVLLELSFMPARWLMFLSRLIAGIGAGNVPLFRTSATTASTLTDRARAMAWVTGAQALGIVGGPAFQLLFSPLGLPGLHLFGPFRLNTYTAPGYFACLTNIIAAALIYFTFTEGSAGVVEKTPKKKQDEEKGVNEPRSQPHIPPYDMMAVVVCNATRFTQMFIQTNLESLYVPFAMTMFAWTKETAITFTSIAQGLFGVMTIALYFCYSYFTLDKRLTYRVMLVSGLLAYLCFHILTFSWPFTSGHLLSFDGSAVVNGTELRGCDIKKFDWCKTQNPVNEWLYNVSYVLTIGFGFPIINLTLMTLFSKILGPRRQGTHQGVLQMSGSIARVIGPIAMR